MGVREEVMAEMVAVAKVAIDQGKDGMIAVLDKFPGTPDAVAAEAWAIADAGKTEEWWTSIERTIDTAVIHNALVAEAKETFGEKAASQLSEKLSKPPRV